MILLLVVLLPPTLSCPPPPVPLAAKASWIPGEERALYSCQEGFRGVGRPEINCVQDIWEKVEFECCTNAALLKPTLGPNQDFTEGSQLAVDGEFHPTRSHHHCHTVPGQWAVDLQQSVQVSGVNISTHSEAGDAYALEVRVGNSSTFSDNPICWFQLKLARGSSTLISCSEEGLYGRYVSISTSGRNSEAELSFCEVEVLTPASQVASSRQCSQSQEGMRVHGNVCILRNDHKMSWDDAKSFCAEHGLQVMRNSTEDETGGFNKLKEEFEQLSRDRRERMYVWIGIARSSNDIWSWLPNLPNSGRLPRAEAGLLEVSQPNWSTHEPGKVGDCAVLDSSLRWTWNAIGCRISAYVGCQAPPAFCPTPPRPQGSLLGAQEEEDGLWAKDGEVWSLHCAPGYQGSGDPFVQCRHGRWSKSSFECHLGPPSTSTTSTIAAITSSSSSSTRVSSSSSSSSSFSPGNFEGIYPPSSPSSNQPQTRPDPSKPSSFPSSPSSNQPAHPPSHNPTTPQVPPRGRIVNQNIIPHRPDPHPTESPIGPVWPMNGPKERPRSQGGKPEDELEPGSSNRPHPIPLLLVGILISTFAFS